MKLKYLIVIISLLACFNPVISQPSKLEGKWLLGLTFQDVGTLRVNMSFNEEGKTFTAHSREGFDKVVMSFFTSFLARTFSGGFDNGSILHINEGIMKITNEGTSLEGVLVSPMGNYYLQCMHNGNSIEGVLLNKVKDTVGFINGEKKVSHSTVSNYKKIVNEIISTSKANIYDKELTRSSEWMDLEESLKEVSGGLKDDAEMIFAFYYFSEDLPFSHFYLQRKMSSPQIPQSNETAPGSEMKEYPNSTLYWKIPSLAGTAAEVDLAFSVIEGKGYKNLIIDLRGNPGGSIEAGLRAAQYLVQDTIYGGIFLTRKWFDKHSALPSLNEYKNFEAISEANYDLLLKGIHEHEGLVMKVIPSLQPYKGKVYILVDNNTASTCEPLVYGLKQHGYAKIIGEKTAGAMLSSEMFELEDNFRLVIPVADYYTSDGYRIDGNGVMPDILSQDALNKALSLTK